MSWNDEQRMKFANALMVIGGILIVSVFGLGFGIPLFVWGYDLKRQLREEQSRTPGGVEGAAV
jgi:hypothetical protein